jgi:large subunit ribosomal protein L23
MNNVYAILERPLVTEKTAALNVRENSPQYVFKVARGANKVEIRKAVEETFNVKVAGINTVLVKGKLRRQGRSVGHQPNWKKAYVTLQKGHEIKF